MAAAMPRRPLHWLDLEHDTRFLRLLLLQKNVLADVAKWLVPRREWQPLKLRHRARAETEVDARAWTGDEAAFDQFSEPGGGLGAQTIARLHTDSASARSRKRSAGDRCTSSDRKHQAGRKTERNECGLHVLPDCKFPLAERACIRQTTSANLWILS